MDIRDSKELDRCREISEGLWVIEPGFLGIGHVFGPAVITAVNDLA